MRRIRRPMLGRRRRLRMMRRRFEDFPQNTIMLEVDNFPKGSEWTASDYVKTHEDGLSVEEVDEILGNLVAQGKIDAECKEENGVKVYTKTKDSQLPFYIAVENILTNEDEFSAGEIIDDDLPYGLRCQIKEEVIDKLVELNEIRKITETDYILNQKPEEPKFHPVDVFLKAMAMNKQEWTLTEVLGEKPDNAVIRNFEALIYDDDYHVYKKGFNNKGEMVYIVSKEDYNNIKDDNNIPLDINEFIDKSL